MTYTAGIDIGSGAVKTVLFRDNDWIAKRVERIRRRDPMELAKLGFDEVLQEANLKPENVPTSPPPAKAKTSSSPPATSIP
jgi:benzoyl-CoA reductase subunit D